MSSCQHASKAALILFSYCSYLITIVSLFFFTLGKLSSRYNSLGMTSDVGLNGELNEKVESRHGNLYLMTTQLRPKWVE